jgi:hypothetical protein
MPWKLARKADSLIATVALDLLLPTLTFNHLPAVWVRTEDLGLRHHDFFVQHKPLVLGKRFRSHQRDQLRFRERGDTSNSWTGDNLLRVSRLVDYTLEVLFQAGMAVFMPADHRYEF